MPTVEWLKKEFHYGYDSGDVEANIADEQRKQEEQRIGGSYNEIAQKLLRNYIKSNDNVLELGPGRGSWSRVILDILDDGTLTTLDFQDISKWLDMEKYKNKLIPYQVNSMDYSFLEDNTYDVFWSFGVLCHNNIDSIYQILHNIYPKMKKDSILIHQYADWEKLDDFGWERGAVPVQFKSQKDDEIWWPRNNKKVMQIILEANGFEIVDIDCGLVERDSIFICKKL